MVLVYCSTLWYGLLSLICICYHAFIYQYTKHHGICPCTGVENVQDVIERVIISIAIIIMQCELSMIVFLMLYNP